MAGTANRQSVTLDEFRDIVRDRLMRLSIEVPGGTGLELGMVELVGFLQAIGESNIAEAADRLTMR